MATKIMAKVELSFVIPAFNEEDSIEFALLSLDELVKDTVAPYEIVVVDDGSKDKTFTKAIKYANRNGHVRVITYPTNLGKGYAVRTGFMQATGEVVVFVDSDMDIDFDIIPEYVVALKDADIVIASKWHPDSSVNLSTSRRILSHGFNVMTRFLTGAKLKDTQVVVEMPVKLELNKSFKLNELFKMLVDLLGIAYRLRLTRWYQRTYAGN
jgi:glycosyltransferase involved in cell wall biosynthesis